jgi:hypothetical protein
MKIITMIRDENGDDSVFVSTYSKAIAEKITSQTDHLVASVVTEDFKTLDSNNPTIGISIHVNNDRVPTTG